MSLRQSATSTDLSRRPVRPAAAPRGVATALPQFAATPGDMLRLQRAVGNRAVTRLIQTKLTVGPAGDRYEQEADRVAQQVLTMPTPARTQPTVQRAGPEEEEIQTKPLATSITPVIQRAGSEEEEEIQAKPLTASITPVIQRAGPEEEEEVQAKPLVQRSGGGFQASADLEQRLDAGRGGGAPLPSQVRAFMEPRFGTDFSGVRVHTGGEAAQLNRSISAQAFTHGQNIYVGEGKYSPGSDAGKRLLAHELTHVVQQGGASTNRQTARHMTAQRVIQRYEIQDSQQEFATQKLEVKGGETPKLDYSITQEQTNLKVSDDGEMATPNAPQAKEMFASEAVLKDSNQRLRNAKSVVSLQPGAGSVTVFVPGTQQKATSTLARVEPQNIQDPTRSVYHDLSKFQENCNIMAGLVMGKSNVAHEKGLKVVPRGEGQRGKLEPVNYREMIESRKNTEIPTDTQAKGENQYAMPDVGEAYATFSSGEMDPGKHWTWHFAGVVARRGGDAITLENYTRGGEYQKALMTIVDSIVATREDLATQIIEIVKGEGLEYLLPEGVEPKDADTLGKLMGVVKRVSEEQSRSIKSALVYAVNKVNQGLVGLNKISQHDPGQISNALWYFHMYGPPNKVKGTGETEDQSYHAEMAKSGDFSQPLTLRIRNQEGREAETSGISAPTQNIVDPPQPNRRGKVAGAFRNKFTKEGRAAKQLKQAARALVARGDFNLTDIDNLESRLTGTSRTILKARYTLKVLRLGAAMKDKAAEIKTKAAIVWELPEGVPATLRTMFGQEVTAYEHQYDQVTHHVEYQNQFGGAPNQAMRNARAEMTDELQSFVSKEEELAGLKEDTGLDDLSSPLEVVTKLMEQLDHDDPQGYEIKARHIRDLLDSHPEIREGVDQEQLRTL